MSYDEQQLPFSHPSVFSKQSTVFQLAEAAFRVCLGYAAVDEGGACGRVRPLSVVSVVTTIADFHLRLKINAQYASKLEKLCKRDKETQPHPPQLSSLPSEVATPVDDPAGALIQSEASYVDSDSPLTSLSGEEGLSDDEPVAAAIQSEPAGSFQNLGEIELEKEVDEANRAFGEAPRDVFQAVFDGHDGLKEKIQTALVACHSNIDELFTALRALGTVSSMTGKDAPSHRLFAFYPSPGDAMGMKNDSFIPEFKSKEIGKQVLSELGRLQVAQAKKIVSLFKLFPESSTFAGWIFESLANDHLANEGIRDLYSMTSTKKDAVLYTIDGLQKSKSKSKSSTRKRLYRDVILTPKSLEWPNEGPIEHYFYVPENQNNPLFDSFCVDYNKDRTKADIWIIQTTISPEHKGSSKGYKLIKAIRKHVISQGKMTMDNDVTLNYVLVCPSSPQRERKWHLPLKGWDKCIGNVYCQFIDVDVREYFCLEPVFN